jgi:hypothetical protein
LGKNTIAFFIIYSISILIELVLFGSLVYAPNDRMIVFGGDGFVIYYNQLEHICNGGGLMLQGMGLPWYEYIFMTDSQAVFSIILSWLNDIGLPICEYGIGIIHSLIYFTLPLGAYVVFLILRKLDIDFFWSIVFCILINFLSPQMIRMSGHLGLLYLFLLPLCILWVFHYTNYRKFDKYAFGIMFLLTFFGLNNAYLGIIMGGFLLLCIIFLDLRDYLSTKKIKLSWAYLVSLIPIAIIFLIVKVGDPIEGRLEYQWGFFAKPADIQGLLVGEGSLFRYLFDTIIDIKDIPFEGRFNLGLVAGVTIIFLFFRFLYWLVKRDYSEEKSFPLLIEAPLFSALVMFVLANHLFLSSDGKDFLESLVGKLVNFKGSGRFVWPLYYVLTLTAVYYLVESAKKLNKRKKHLAYLFLVPLVFIWIFEIHVYLSPYKKKINHKNYFKTSERQKIKDVLDTNQILKEDYQGIYTLPLICGWNDKLSSRLNWGSHFYAMRYALEIQRPLINAMFSRSSIPNTMRHMQFASHPALKKEILDYLDPNKKVLIVRSKINDQLSIGEQYIADESKLLHTEKDYELRSLSLSDLDRSSFIDTLLSKKDVFVEKELIYYNGFENSSSEHQFYGGSRTLEKGSEVVDSFQVIPGKKINFTAWVYLDSYKYRLPIWKIHEYDMKGKYLGKKTFNCKLANDFHNSWLKVEKDLQLNKKTSSIAIQVESNQTFYIDEIWIKESGANIYKTQIPSNVLFYNNIPLVKD